MRNILLGTTAIVAVTAAAPAALATDKIELNLRGYAQFGVAGIVDEPASFEGRFSEGNNIIFGSDSEVHFRGSTTLDNGLAISFRAELELENDSEVDRDADVIDEVYVQLQSGLGRLQFGMQDGVADQMIISAPNVFKQFTISSIDMNPFELYTSADLDDSRRDVLGESSYLDTSPDFSDDFTKIIFITPRVAGAQLGVSYAPNPCRNDTGLDLNNRPSDSTATDLDNGDADPDAIRSCGSDHVFGSNFWEVAGNFKQEWNGFGVGFSASYGMGDGNDLDFGGTVSGGPEEWHVGGQMYFNIMGGKLVIGGAYKETENIDALNRSLINLRLDRGFVQAASQHFDAGAKFSTGPWAFGVAYGEAESTYMNAALVPDDWRNELTLIIGGVSYKMGPGIKLGLGVIHGDSVEHHIGHTHGPDATSTAVFSELDLRF